MYFVKFILFKLGLLSPRLLLLKNIIISFYFLSFDTLFLDNYSHSDREFFIQSYLHSLNSQRFKDWEAIVVDDGSSDNSFSILQHYSAKDSRIRVVKNTTSKTSHGPYSARNMAIEISSGGYLCFHDVDDFWLNHFFLITSIF